MGHRARLRRRREEEEEELEGPAPPTREPGAADETTTGQARPADRALDLQRSAGNRAVGAALSRWGLPWVPPAATPQWPKESEVIFDGEAIPVVSFAWVTPRGGTGTSGPGHVEYHELEVSIRAGEHSAELARAASAGRPFEKVVLVLPGANGTGVTVTLTDVVIMSFSSSGDVESLRLNFKAHTIGSSPPAP